MLIVGKRRSWIALLTVGLAPPLLGAGPADSGKKLIEFGWDEPDPAFMRKHIKEMKQTPFDGCVYHLNYKDAAGRTGSFTWECWGRRAFKKQDLAEGLAELKATDFGRFSHNFLRFNVTPMDLGWFDDFSAILNNARLAAQFAKAAGMPGLLFDIEQYGTPLFNYQKQPDHDKRSWEEYARQVRQHGREVMNAFQEGYPDLTVFLTFGYVLPWEETEGKVERLKETSYGLLAPFLDGLVESVRGRTRLIDGCESAYRFKKEKNFESFHRLLRRDLLPMVANHEKYGRHFSVSYGLWLDYDWRHEGWNTEDFGKNHHTPDQFEMLTRAALKNADEYVWVYSETPRWWTDKGGPEKLPAAYIDAVRGARNAPSSQPATRRSP